MKYLRLHHLFVLVVLLQTACKKETVVTPLPPPTLFKVTTLTINGNEAARQSGVNFIPAIRVALSAPVNLLSANTGVALTLVSTGAYTPVVVSFTNGDSVLQVRPVAPLSPIAKYILTIKQPLSSKNNTYLSEEVAVNFITAIDSTNKFPILSDSALLDKIQQQTFAYFWAFGHPVSGMARERNTSGDLVTSGGTGFGIMAMVAAVNRKFITRAAGVERITKITSFLQNNCTAYHGAFAHWINGATGATIPFSANDDGADLVETAYLMQGLLTARQYFNTADVLETALRNNINFLWNAVNWNWFQQENKNTLYWHWSPGKSWIMNTRVSGWNEALITYVLAAASPTHAIAKPVYDSGWARNGAIKNNAVYFGFPLPLGPALGGPLFFEHYSFLGINPNGLNDAYANYQTQAVNHTKINYTYCVANPRQWYGYSSQCWGLTASDMPGGGYNANAPDNDQGVIAPTAAISSLPYTPTESMNALRFFYYTLGDKIFKDYGFTDAFSLHDAWFATSTLAIDQGPIIIMIENYRSGLLWNLFTSAPEIKSGMRKLGCSASYL